MLRFAIVGKPICVAIVVAVIVVIVVVVVICDWV
jgi:hypothetical protein